MADALRRFLGTHAAWVVARTRKGFSVRVRTPGQRRHFRLITYIPDTTRRGEQLARGIAALPELVRELSALHDAHTHDWEQPHRAAERPDICETCALLQRATEVQP